MKFLLFIFLMILDIIVFIFLIIFEEYFIPILILHTLIYIISWSLYLKFDNKMQEVPFYIILFMPILGPILFFVFYFSINYFYGDNEVIDDYEQNLDANLELESRKRLDYEREIKTMSFMDLLSFIDPERKKEILIDSHYSTQINNAKILKKGLESEDKEVQHYSATLLNSKENELTNNISYLRERFNATNNEKMLDELINSYQVYIHSSLIEPDSIDIFRNEYIDVLLQKVNRNTYDLHSLLQLFDAYIQIDDIYNAEIINEKIKKEFHSNKDTKLNHLNILYKRGNISQLRNELNNLDSKELKENHRLKELHDFFIEER